MQKNKGRPRRAFFCGLSIAGFASVTAIPAYAKDEPQYRVDFTAPKDLPNCNDPNGFRALLELAQPRDLFDVPATRVLDVRLDAPNNRDIIAEITVKAIDGEVRASRSPTYPRSMECYKILHLVAVAAATELDRDAPVELPSSPPPLAKPPASAPCPPCDVPLAPRPKPQRRWFVGTGLRVDFGVAPDQLFGGHFVAGWRASRSWSVEGHLGVTAPEDTRPLGPTVVRVYSIGSFEFVPCYRKEPFGFCGEFVLGNLWFAPRNLAQPRVDSALFLGVGVRGFVEQQLTDRWSVRMDLGLFTPIVPAQIDDDTRQEHWMTSIVSGSGNVSFLAGF